MARGCNETQRGRSVTSITHDRRGSDRIVNSVKDILIAWFPALVILVVIPLDLYLPNQEDFGFNAGLLVPFFSLSVLWAVLLLPLIWVPARFRAFFALILFCIGAFLDLADLLVPFGMEQTASGDAGTLTSDGVIPLFVEITIAAGIVICARRLSYETIRTWGAAVVIILLAAQGVLLWARLSPDSIVAIHGRVLYEFNPRARQIHVTSSRPNVYHIVFDGFASSLFAEAVATGDTKERLDGFTFFPNARANYIWTNYSMASYLTGTFYRKGNVGEWMNQRRSRGVMLDLANAGYTLTLYVPLRYYMHDRAARVIDLVDVASGRGDTARLFGSSDFLDLWMMRVIPGGIGRLVTRLLVTDTTDSPSSTTPSDSDLPKRASELARFLRSENSSDLTRKRWIGKIHDSLPLMRRFLSEEIKRPGTGQYVFLHTYLSHEPHDVLDHECRLKHGARPLDQAACSLKFVMEFIEALKELRRYHQSTIILQADHGSSVTGPSDPDLRMPKLVIDELVALTHFSKDLLCNRTFPLLAVKPPDTSGHAMKTSQASVQLADIPATLYAMLNLTGQDGVGRSVLGVGELEEREIPLFFGFARKNKAGEVQWGGKQFLTGELAHISYTRGRGYRTYPPIPFSWH